MTLESDYSGRIGEFYRKRADQLFVIDVKKEIGFERFAETFDLHDFIAVFPYTDYAGFHATDPNWYEEGKYQTGLLRMDLFQCLERLFREAGLLNDDEVLTPVCHYSEEPGKAWLFPFFVRGEVPRPNIVIEVKGGEYEGHGQFICIDLGERRVFEMVEDRGYIQRVFEGVSDERVRFEQLR